ncbi:hypothetical protein OC835_004595 [Tilletia horrida]|nr:hypothetical protein OC835_004595 [Tilletia horrida]
MFAFSLRTAIVAVFAGLAAFSSADARMLRAASLRRHLVSVRDAGCYDYVLVTTRGTTEPQGPSFAFTTMVQNTLSNVPGGAQVNTEYPAAYDGMSPILGMNALKSYLDDAVQRCPNQKIVLLGYSQGSFVSSLALQSYTDTSSPVFQAIKAIVLLGNPVHQPDFAGNVDDQGGSSTAKAWGAIYSPFTPTVPEVYKDKVKDICLLGDAVCDEKNPNPQNVHGNYGQLQGVQDIGTNFLRQQLQASN